LCKAQGFRLEHLGATIGTVIHGPNLATLLSDDAVQAIRMVMLERKAVFFRGQSLSMEQHINFTKRFGSLEVHPFAGHVDGYPEALRLNHGPGAPGTENIWHSDVTWRARPSLGSVLYCKKTASFGGTTCFADSNAMFLGLPDKLQTDLRGRTAVHDFHSFRIGLLRAGVSPEIVDEMRKRYPIAQHPVVRTHPETGKPTVYVNAAFTRYIDGMQRDESDDLLRKLYAQAVFPEYQCRFHWDEGSVAFWDNRSCQHYATSDYYPLDRVMDRVTIQGDAPFYDVAREASSKL